MHFLYSLIFFLKCTTKIEYNRIICNKREKRDFIIDEWEYSFRQSWSLTFERYCRVINTSSPILSLMLSSILLLLIRPSQDFLTIL